MEVREILSNFWKGILLPDLPSLEQTANPPDNVLAGRVVLGYHWSHLKWYETDSLAQKRRPVTQ